MEDFLDKLGRKLQPSSLDRWWRRIRNRCEQCGARLIAYENFHGKNFVCSRSSKHVRYAADINITAALVALVLVLAILLFARSCGLMSSSERHHRLGDQEIYLAPDPPR